MTKVMNKDEQTKTRQAMTASLMPIGGGRYIMNAIDGVACTLTCAHHYAGNILFPRQGFREMGILEVEYGMPQTYESE